LFPWQLRQSLSNASDFFGFSRATRCGCCSYQVSSISVRRVTCYDLVGISYAMWSSACKGWFFSKWLPCHRNDQNAKKLKNTKMIIADNIDAEEGRLIIIRRRTWAKTICLTNFVWEP
jgi:hypothetical protein